MEAPAARPVPARIYAAIPWCSVGVLAAILGMAIGFFGVAFAAAGIYVVGTVAPLSVVRGHPPVAA